MIYCNLPKTYFSGWRCIEINVRFQQQPKLKSILVDAGMVRRSAILVDVFKSMVMNSKLFYNCYDLNTSTSISTSSISTPCIDFNTSTQVVEMELHVFKSSVHFNTWIYRPPQKRQQNVQSRAGHLSRVTQITSHGKRSN